MEKENFFTKLRRVATSTESETARLKVRMERPVAVRSSAANQDGSSARLVLKEMQYDAQKMKEKVHEQLKGLHTLSGPFEETLDACEGLCEVTRQQVTDLETYLAEYGYSKYSGADAQQSQQESKRKKPSKENMEPAEITPSATTEDSLITEGEVPSTPPKDASIAPPVDPNKTPQLADFGISQWTIDRLAHIGLNGAAQDMKSANFAGYQCGSVPSAIPSHIYPSTPQHSQQPWKRTPFTNRTILVTPGMFGNRNISAETPSQFIDTKSYLEDSPIPPVLMSSVKKGKFMTFDLRVTSRQGMQTASPEPEPPNVTAWAEYIPLPAPPAQLHAPSVTAEVTPPMPPCLAPQATQAPMPAEPARLADRFTGAATLPCEPVQLSQQFSTSEMPTEPVQLAEKSVSRRDSPVEPVQLMAKFGAEIKMPKEPQLLGCQVIGHPSQPITPKGHQRLTELPMDREMPQTPELTMTYQRFVDVKPVSPEPVPRPPRVSGKSVQDVPTLCNSPDDAPRPPVLKSALQEDQPVKSAVGLEAQPASVRNGLEHPIAPVSDAEFSHMADYLQRLIPIDMINQKLVDINAMLAQKQDTTFISEAEMLTLRLGSKTKAFTLLLTKLRRLDMGNKSNSGELVFYIVK